MSEHDRYQIALIASENCNVRALSEVVAHIWPRSNLRVYASDASFLNAFDVQRSNATFDLFPDVLLVDFDRLTPNHDPLIDRVSTDPDLMETPLVVIAAPSTLSLVGDRLSGCAEAVLQKPIGRDARAFLTQLAIDSVMNAHFDPGPPIADPSADPNRSVPTVLACVEAETR